ncbi:xanthine dehydrogenase family protein molybdopterin-binding subunit [Paradesulfitobacterium aromaticivorans]
MIGQDIKKRDARQLVTGSGKFLADLTFPNMLYAKILRSPHAHALIKSIDVSKAKILPGVVAVLTGEDMVGLTTPYGQAGIPDEFVLALDKVRFEGDEVAVVAAESELIAEDALDLITVEYEILPAVVDPEWALKEEAPRIHQNLPGVEGNVHTHAKVRAGDIDKGFAEADYIFKERFETSKPTATPMETHGALATYDVNTERLTLYASTQNAHIIRTLLASVLGLPQSRVTVKSPFVGGAFGHKIDLFAHEVCSAVLAMKTGRPVRIALSRQEEFLASRSRHPQIRYVEAGVKKDGTITAWKERVIQDSGAYSSFGPGVIKLSFGMTVGPYKTRNMWCDGYVVYTNKQPSGAYRGFGNPQATFAREQMLDIIAKKLGISPWEIRQANIVRKQDLPYETCNGLKFKTLAIEECMDQAAKAVNYEELKAAKVPYVGIGMSNMIEWSSCRWNPVLDADTSSSVIKLEDDGSVIVTTDACDAGQGHTTILAQVCANELGVSLDKINVITHDTDLTPHGLGTWGSRTAVVAGTAVKLAAQQVKAQVLKIAAHWLEASAEELEISNNKVFVRDMPDRSVAIGDIAMAAHYTRSKLPPGMPAGAIIGNATYDTPTSLIDENGIGHFSIVYCNSCHMAVVKVDPDTGLVQILDYAVAEDVGRALNPAFVKGQIQGGLAQGVGFALYEDMVYDANGHLLNPSFTNYQVPTMMDLPMLDEKIFEIETNDPEVPDGQKGIGESALTNPPAAIANAIHDAIGVPIMDLPITPEKILKAIRSKNA